MSFLIAAFVFPSFLLLLAVATVGEAALATWREWTEPPQLPKDIEALRPLARMAASQARLMRYDHEEDR